MRLGATGATLTIPEGADPILGRIERAAELGLKVLSVGLRDASRDGGYLRAVRDLAAEKGIELRGGGFGASWYVSGAEADAAVEQATEVVSAGVQAGILGYSTPPGPMDVNRWHPGPPALPERLRNAATNLGRLADNVRKQNAVITLENHCDLRGHEVVQVIEMAGRPNLRAQLDTGNAFSVFEDPVECAKVMAPYTVSVHLKDIHVTPFASGAVRGTRGVNVPLGQGHVDNVAICRILEESAPTRDIPLMIEPFYLEPTDDREVFLATSLAWARVALAAFLA